MSEQVIPSAHFGICGGSGSLSFDFPAALGDERVEVLGEGLVYDTPFGRSPAFTHFRVERPARLARSTGGQDARVAARGEARGCLAADLLGLLGGGREEGAWPTAA